MALMDRWQSKYPHPDEVRMTLGEHLDELRSRLIKAIAALLVGAIICYVFRNQVMGFLTAPIFAVMRNLHQKPDLSFLHPAEAFMTYIKVSIVVGFILTAPYSLTQVWGFIAAGLYPHERRWVRRFVPVSIGLFFTGAAFLLMVVSPLLLHFLLTYPGEVPDYTGILPTWLLPKDEQELDPGTVRETWPESPGSAPASMPAFDGDPANPPQGTPWFNREAKQVRVRWGKETFRWGELSSVTAGNAMTPRLRVSEYIMFMLQLAAAFGIGFQVPVVVAFVAMIGVASAAQMGTMRRYVWFGMAIVAAIVTPPDVGSMLFLLVPMALLYEVGLIAARFLERERGEGAG